MSLSKLTFYLMSIKTFLSSASNSSHCFLYFSSISHFHCCTSSSIFLSSSSFSFSTPFFSYFLCNV